MKNVIYLVATLLLGSCNAKIEKKKLDFDKVAIDVKNAKSWEYSNLIDSSSCSYIKLETSPRCLMGRIDRFYIYNGKYVFIANKKVFVFNEEGRFLYRIDKKGKGNGEYLSIADVYVDKDGFVFILDRRGRKILKYDESGKHLSSLNTGLIGESFIRVDSDTWGIYIGSNKNKASSYRLNFYSEIQQRIVHKKQLISNNEYKWMYFDDVNNFTQSPGFKLFNYSCNDTIYSFRDADIQPYAVVDFGNNKLPASILNNEYNDLFDFIKKVRGKYIYSMLGFFSNKTHLSFGFRLKKNTYQALFDLKTKKVKVVSKISDPYFVNGINVPVQYGLLPKASDSEFFYSIIDPTFTDELLKKSGKKHDLFSKMNINENPVIIKYKYTE